MAEITSKITISETDDEIHDLSQRLQKLGISDSIDDSFLKGLIFNAKRRYNR